MNNKNRVVIIAAHPDDEILGCGGTAALHVKNGDEVFNIIFCEGESHRYKDGSVNQDNFIEKASQIIGVTETRHLKFPDQHLDQYSLVEIIDPLLMNIRDIKPNIIYCQFGGDINRDHKILFEAALVATRPVEEYIDKIYAFDTASSTEWSYPRNFVPDTWVDISGVLDIKLRAMECYESELKKYPHPRSLKALEYKSKAWGNQCCLEAAEVFMTIRRIVRYGKTNF